MFLQGCFLCNLLVLQVIIPVKANCSNLYQGRELLFSAAAQMH